MFDPGYILHVFEGRHYLYLANFGQPYGRRMGPYPDEAAAHAAGAVLRRLHLQASPEKFRFRLMSTCSRNALRVAGMGAAASVRRA